MNTVAIIITASGVVLLALLMIQSRAHRVFYAKPIVGVGMFIGFGLIFAALAEYPAVLGTSEITALLISSLGMVMGIGWAVEGLDKLSHLEEGEK
jgi:hypothetical protein